MQIRSLTEIKNDAIDKAKKLHLAIKELISVTNVDSARDLLSELRPDLQADLAARMRDAYQLKLAEHLCSISTELLQLIATKDKELAAVAKKISDIANERTYDEGRDDNDRGAVKRRTYEPNMAILLAEFSPFLVKLETTFPEILPAKTIPVKVEPEIAIAKEDAVATITLYRAKNGSLAVMFSNPHMYRAFLNRNPDTASTDFQVDNIRPIIYFPNVNYNLDPGVNYKTGLTEGTLTVTFLSQRFAQYFNLVLLGSNKKISIEKTRTRTTYNVSITEKIMGYNGGVLSDERSGDRNASLDIPVTEALNNAAKEMIIVHTGLPAVAVTNAVAKSQQAPKTSSAPKTFTVSKTPSIAKGSTAGFIANISSSTQTSSSVTQATPTSAAQTPTSAAQTASTPQSDEISLYRATNGEIAVDFNSQELRDAVLYKISSKFGKGSYVGIIDNNNNTIYFHKFQTLKNKVYQIDFGSRENAQECQNLLFAKRTDIAMIYNGSSIQITDHDNVLAKASSGERIVIQMSDALKDARDRFIQDGAPEQQPRCSMM